jgi:hypothetical protein
MTGNKTVTATFSMLPVANAGVPQTVKSNSLVTLDGSGSSGAHLPLTYQWLQSGGQTVVLNSATISMPVFTAPGIITQAQMISFTLVVTDQLGLASEPSHVVITVEPYRAHLPVVYKP